MKNNQKQQIFTSDPDFLKSIAEFEACADRSDDHKHLDFYACETCPVLKDCVSNFDKRMDFLRDKPVSSKEVTRLDKQRRGLKKQLNLC